MFCSSIMLEETGYDSRRKIENEKNKNKNKTKQKIRSCRVKSTKAIKNSSKEFEGIRLQFIYNICMLQRIIKDEALSGLGNVITSSSQR